MFFKESENFPTNSGMDTLTPKVAVKELSEKQQVEKYYELLDRIGLLTKENRVTHAFEIRELRKEKENIEKNLEGLGVTATEMRPEDYNKE